ncbi:MAG: alpha-amylase family glycosyl hydrolase, partial [Chloroflexota bacterium]|nr:alpha-amylase family glycosyl hydrolase [Chloroflexota bacterium]
KRVTGTCPGVPSDARITLLVNDLPVPANHEGGTFSVTVRLCPGVNEVAAVAELSDGRPLRSHAVTHAVRLSPRPTARITLQVIGKSVVLHGGDSAPSEYDGAPIRTWTWTVSAGDLQPLVVHGAAGSDDVTEMWGAGETLTVALPPVDGEYYASLRVLDEVGRTDVATARLVVEAGVGLPMNALSEPAAWVDQAVVYGMVLRNFTGEGFRGATDRMNELADLGITAIWLAPITGGVSGDFGYAVTDYFGVREKYGTLDDLRALVDAAHSRGIRVLMDFVPNHTSVHHPYFMDAEEHGKTSPYYDFYDRDDAGAPTHYFNWSKLPNLNFDNPEVRRFITEAFTFWIQECDVDGFRVDAAWGIRERRPDYWHEWSTELNRIKPDSLLIAEASARDPFYVHNGFDAAYDWTDELGVWAWTDVFTGDLPVGMAMRHALTMGGKGYDENALVFRFLNNNDTGPRFLTTHGLGCYRVAMAMLMTLPGIPCIYTGDEVGGEFQPYEDTGVIDWSDPCDLQPFVRRLIQLRKEHPGLHSRTWEHIEIEPAGHLFGYLRESADRSERLMVALNFSANDIVAAMPLPAGTGSSLSRTCLVDLWAGDKFQAESGDGLFVAVPAWGFRIMKAVPAVEGGAA